jgi:hypothetical protein
MRLSWAVARRILGIGDPGHEVGADHHRAPRAARFDLPGADRERGQKARARRADVECAGVQGAELVRHLGRGVRHDLIRGGSGDQHEVDLLGEDPGAPQRRGGGTGRVRDEPLRGVGHAAGVNPRAPHDPFVGHADPGRDLIVADDPLGQAHADRRDRRAGGQDGCDRSVRFSQRHTHS